MTIDKHDLRHFSRIVQAIKFRERERVVRGIFNDNGGLQKAITKYDLENDVYIIPVKKFHDIRDKWLLGEKKFLKRAREWVWDEE